MDVNLRRVYNVTPVYQRDIYPDFWALYIYDQVPFSLRSYLPKIPGWESYKVGVYVPTYQLFDVRLSEGVSSWRSYCARDMPEPFAGGQTSVFWYTGPDDIVGYTFLVDYLRKMRDFMVPLRVLPSRSRLGQLTDFMHTHFCEEGRMEDIYRALRLPVSTADYFFDRFYGMTAVSYRNKLRIFRGLKLIRDGRSLTEICYDLGYNDYSTFYRQFCRNIGVPPSNFVLGPAKERVVSKI